MQSRLLQTLRGGQPAAEGCGEAREAEDSDALAERGGQITPDIERVIRAHLAGRPSTLTKVATIGNQENPAFRGTGHAEMCLAAVGLARGECVGCFPGEIRGTEPFGSYEDSFAIMTSNGEWLVPTQ
jgi:hypothetical protein